MTIGGVTVVTFVIDTTLTLSGDVQGTITSTTWLSPEYVLPVQSHTVTDIMYGLLPVHADITATLLSFTPS